ncbi:hypothetical protein H6P81_018844 [Aristolochia fimbriata]|uniref:F-box domain-containing protein n=1 Tax=Aristolochia fimbriata TaxID=158543 RepID=A0AAV7E4E2_ARIFI|nr:hypothetical protein H6P81_018844 [Aristolochia fimbriata]
MLDQINEISHKDKMMKQQNEHNKEQLHMTSVESLEGVPMEEKLKFVVPDLGEDRISELPETVLLHILSYLPTKDSIRTSLVAKRWRFLWKAVPSLNFQFSMERSSLRNPSHKNFLDFVDKVFMHRDSSALSKFCVSYFNYGAGVISFKSRFKLWTEAIARAKVKSLELRFNSPLTLQLSTMETLEMLRLVANTWSRQNLNLHSLSGLRHLKVLKLAGILNVIRNYSIKDCEIRISTPRLKSFFLEGCSNFAFDGFCSLSKLVIANNSSDPICVSRLCKIVTAGTHLKIFSWRCSYSMWSELVENLRACVATPFTNMKQLCLHLYRCNCDDYVDSVIYLLENCPNLEKLVITGFEGRPDLGEHCDKNCKPATDPSNFTHPSLKEIEIVYNRKDCLQREWLKLLNGCSPRLKLKRTPMKKRRLVECQYFAPPSF